MIKFENLKSGKVNEIGTRDNSIAILKALNKLIGAVKNPEILNDTIKIQGSHESLLSTYSSICILLAESYDLISEEIDKDELIHSYMIMIKQILEGNIHGMSNAIFGGLSEVGMAIHALNKVTPHYNNFLSTLNKYIVTTTKESIKVCKENVHNLSQRDFDTMSGLTGVTAYLLLFRKDEEIRNLIKEALEYFVLLTRDREVKGHILPNYYIHPKNMFTEQDKIMYPDGFINLGISHGITGPMAVLSLALLDGIEIEGQKEAINRILEDLITFSYTADNEGIYWPGIIALENYLQREAETNINRASWCYGTPGIARAMFLASKAVDNKPALELSIKALHSLCIMEPEDWMLNSPTICHGYAGILAVLEGIDLTKKDLILKTGVQKLSNLIIKLYNEDLPFGFINIDPKPDSEGKLVISEWNSLTLISGSVGVMLALLESFRVCRIDWMRQFLIR